MTQALNVAIESSQINSSGVLQVAGGGTGVTSSTGSGSNVLNTSPTLVTPALGTPSSGTLTNCTGLPNAGLVNSSVTVNSTAIALGGSATITAVNPNALTIGTGLSGTSYNGSSAVTIANTGVTSITAGSGISVSGSTGGVTISASSSAKILQVISTDFATLVTVSGGLATVSGFSATITPSSSSNKVLVMVSVAFGFSGDTYPYVLLQRNGTSIFTGSSASGAQSNVFLGGYGTASSGAYRIMQQSKNVLDSPATTSAVTYQIAAACPFGAPGYINRQGDQSNNAYIQYPTSTITLMEVTP